MISSVTLFACLMLFQTESANQQAWFEMTSVRLGVSPSSHVLVENNTVDGATWDITFQGRARDGDLILGELVGPGLAAPISVSAPLEDGQLNVPMSNFPQKGTFYLTNIRMERNGQHVMYAEPQKTKIEVVSQVLVSRVEVEQLTRADLERLGYVFNERDYHTVKFQLTLLIQGQNREITVPVALPKVAGETYKPVVLEDPFEPVLVTPLIRMPPESVDLPPPGGGEEGPDSKLVYSFLVIPGEFSYLKSQFNVGCIVANVAEAGVEAYVGNITSNLLLPSPEAYGFPLEVDGNPTRAVLHEGADGTLGTEDDRDSLMPGEEAQVSYTVRGNVAGVYTVYASLNGVMDLPQGQVRLNSVAQGRVLVRSAEYHVDLEHPDIVSEGEPYDFSFTVTNTGEIPIEGFSSSILENQLVGVSIISGDPEQAFPDLAPGDSHTVNYVMLPAMTGRVASSYFRVTDHLGKPTSGLNFYMGVGQSGERLTPVAFVLPQKLEDFLPEPLFQEVRRYGKKIHDFSAQPAEEMPPGVLQPKRGVASAMLRDLSHVGDLVDIGYDSRRSAMRFLSRYVNSQDLRAPIDAVRRHILSDGFQVETELGNWLESLFTNATADEILEVLAQENEGALPFVAAVVDGTLNDVIFYNDKQRKLGKAGPYSVPFSSIIQLNAQRFLVLSYDVTARQLEVRGNSTDVALMTYDGTQHYRYDAEALPNFSTLTLPVAFDGAVQVSVPGETPAVLNATPMDAFPFELISALQLDFERFPEADIYGRQVLFLFSKPVSLESLKPLDEKLTINGASVADVRLVFGGSAVIASARMPLGPYRNIPYRIGNVTSATGMTLSSPATGSVQPSPKFTGVTVSGRIFDSENSDLTAAKVFLILRKNEESLFSRAAPTQVGEGLVVSEDHLVSRAVIVATKSPGVDGRFSFDMVPNRVFDRVYDGIVHKPGKSFTLGFLLEDGRYEERTYHPAGVAQEVQADIAFVAQGRVTGYVKDTMGNPLVGARIYAKNLDNPLTAQIIETDSEGYYSVGPMDVGKIQIKALHQNQFGVAIGHLTRDNSPLEINVTIDHPRASLKGVVGVRRPDGSSYPLTDVFVGVVVNGSFESYETFQYGPTSRDSFRYQASTYTNSHGQFSIPDAAAGFAQISFYHPRYGFGFGEIRTNLLEGANEDISYYFSAAQAGVNGGEVSGQVLNTLGQPVANMKLAMGPSVIYSDDQGRFYFDDVPLFTNTTVRAIDAYGQQIGYTSTYLDDEIRVRTGLTLLVRASVFVEGQFLDTDGTPMAYSPVFIFEENSHDPTARGTKIAYGVGYEAIDDSLEARVILEDNIYNNLGLFGSECVPTTITNEQGRFMARLVWSPQATYGFTGINPPKLAELRNQVIDPENPHSLIIQNRERSGFSVQLLDPVGNPVNGNVLVVSDKVELSNCDLLGTAARKIGEFNNIGVDGYVTIPEINHGLITVSAYTPLFGEVSFTQPFDGAPELFTLQYDDIQQGTLFGKVYDVNGVDPAPEGTRIFTGFRDISFTAIGGTNDATFTALLDVLPDGRYRYPPLVNGAADPMPVHVIVYNEQLNLFSEAFFQLDQETLIQKDMVLKHRGNVKIRVFNSDGSPADFAALKIRYRDIDMVYDATGKHPKVSEKIALHQVTPDEPFVYLTDLPSGAFVVEAVAENGLQSGRLEYSVPASGRDIEVAVYLEASSSIEGTFVDAADQPLTNAEVQLYGAKMRNLTLLETALSDDTPENAGRFGFFNFPMGRYLLQGIDPATRLLARKEVITTPFEPNVEVTLKLAPVFDVTGVVYDGDGVPVAGATIEIRTERGQDLLYIGTDSNGVYRIDKIRGGSYSLKASKPVVEGHGISQLIIEDDMPSAVTHDIHYRPTMDLEVLVKDIDGQHMGTTHVSILGGLSIQRQGFTNDLGVVVFKDLPAGIYNFESLHPLTRHYAFSRIILDESSAGTTAQETVTFRGRGAIRGYLTTDQGEPMFLGAAVTANWSEPYYNFGIGKEFSVGAHSDEDGFFYLAGLPLDLPMKITAFDPLSLQRETVQVTLTNHGEEHHLDLELKATSNVSGQVRYADGSPAAFASLRIESPVQRLATANANGEFTFRHILPGQTEILVEDLAQLREARYTVNLSYNDVGELEPVTGVVIDLSPVGTVFGTLEYANGDSVTGGYAALFDEADRERYRSVVLADGSFRMSKVMIGDWTLRGYSSEDDYWSEPVSVSLAEDGEVSDFTVPMAQDYLLSGQTLDAQEQPLLEAHVTLYRKVGDRYEVFRVGESNDQGYYAFTRLFPGDYRVQAFTENKEQSGFGELLFSATSDVLGFDISLYDTSILNGVVQDGNQVPYNDGKVRLTQFGKVHKAEIQNGGQFTVADLVPGPYTIEIDVLDGFERIVNAGILSVGSNVGLFETETTYSFTGSAVLLGNDGYLFGNIIHPEGRKQRLWMDRSGKFVLERLPGDRVYTLEFSRNGFRKSFEIGPLTEDTFIEAPFEVDGTPPEVNLLSGGGAISLPWQPSLQLIEDTPGFALDEETLQVWVNYTNVTEHFLNSGSAWSADFNFYPPGMKLGENTLRVRVGNDSRGFTTETYTVTPAQSGNSLIVELYEIGHRVEGDVWLESEAGTLYPATVDQGAVITGLPNGTYRIHGASGFKGSVVELDLDGSQLTRVVKIALQDQGSYQGYVRLADGSPAAGATVAIRSTSTTADSNGFYSFLNLPVNQSYKLVTASLAGDIGYSPIDRLVISGQVALVEDIVLDAPAQMSGVLTDGDGVTPVENAQVKLSVPYYTDELGQETYTDAQGQYSFTGLYPAGMKLSAKHPTDQRFAYADVTIVAGNTYDIDLDLTPTYDFAGQILLPDGSPAAHATIFAKTSIYGPGEPSAIADANGQFSLENIQPSSLDLYMGSADGEYALRQKLRSAQYLDSNLGTFQLQPNEAPMVTLLSVPDAWDPDFTMGVQARFKDDIALRAATFVLDGVFNYQKQYNLNYGIDSGSYPYIKADGQAIPEGALTVTVVVEDLFGKTHELSQTVEVRYDAEGPLLALIQPDLNQVYSEGQAITVAVSASDVNDVARVALYYQGYLMGERSAAPYSFDTFVPDDALSLGSLTFDVVAEDGLGHQSNLPVTLQVDAVVSGHSATVQIVSPVDGVPQPLGMQPALQLPLIAEAQDALALAHYQWVANGTLLAEGQLFGPTARLQDLVPLPAPLQDATQLDIQLLVTNVAGVTATSTVQVVRIDGDVIISDLSWSLPQPGNDTRTLILAGGNHIMDGHHQIKDLILVNGATLSHSDLHNNSTFVGLHAEVSDALVVNFGSAIHADGKGLQPNSDSLDLYLPGSFAGLSQDQDAFTARNIYGSAVAPFISGSGSSAGGVVRLAANSLWLSGRVSACSDYERASGGSVWLVADHMAGWGQVHANAWLEGVSARYDAEGSGGRIAIYGTFYGEVQAFGGPSAAAGTIYRAIPDASYPDGIRDQLSVSNLYGDAVLKPTFVPTLSNLIVGTDFSYNTYNQDGQSVGVITFFDPTLLVPNAYLGFDVQLENSGNEPAVVFEQGEDRLSFLLPPGFVAPQAGESWSVNASFDVLEINNGGLYDFLGRDVTEQLLISNAGISVGLGQDLSQANMTLNEAATFVGNGYFGDMTLTDTAALTFRNVPQFENLVIQSGTHFIDGTIVANTVAVDAGATLAGEPGQDTLVEISAGTINIAGVVSNVGNTMSTYLAPNHGAAGGSGSAFATYGSLYQPSHGGRGLGGSGLVRMSFDQMTLTGLIDVKHANHQGTPGAIFLAGRVNATLTGTGTLDASAPYTLAQGGGRIAVHVNDMTGFSGSAIAYGGSNDFDENAGAGTVFYKTAEFPNGKLVIDNNGNISVPGATNLPGLGVQTLNSDLAAQERIAIDGIVPGLAGLYAVWPDGSRHRLGDHDEDEIRVVSGTFPAVTAGDDISGLHVLDVLEVRGGASFYSPDPIELLTPVVIEGAGSSIGATVILAPSGDGQYSDGDFTVSDSNLTQLELSNADVVVDVALPNLQTVTLDALSTLTYYEPITAQTITIDGGQLIAATPSSSGLTAQNLTLSNGALWTVSDVIDNVAFDLVGTVTGNLIVDATSRIAIDHSSQLTSTNTAWGSSTIQGSNGGYRGSDSAHLVQQVGSFADPQVRSAGFGGVIRLAASALQLDGEVSVFCANSNRSGGSIRIDAPTLTGSGKLVAVPHLNGLGGGRIAVYTDNDTFLDTLAVETTFAYDTADFANYGTPTGFGGAGTFYLKTAADQHGRLIIDQRMDRPDRDYNSQVLWGRHKLTGITSPGVLKLNLNDDDPDPRIIRDLSWLDLPPGLAGLYIRYFDGTSNRDVRILGNSFRELFLAEDIEPILPAGTELQFVLKLDELQLKNGANLSFDGLIEVDQLTREGATINGIHAQSLQLTGTQLTLQDEMLRLSLGDPTALQNFDVVLNNATWIVDQPLQIGNLDMVQSTVSHSLVISGSSHIAPLYDVLPWLHLTANQVTMDANSVFDVSQKANYFANHGYTHGSSVDPATDPVYGSALYPSTFGSSKFLSSVPGGRLYLRAQSLSDGVFFANGSLNTGGSIWLDIDQVNGNLVAHANSASNNNRGAGRVAVYYGTGDETHFDLQAENTVDTDVAPGSVFVKAGADTYGRLYFTGANPNTRGQVALPGFATQTLAAGFGATYDAGSDSTRFELPGVSLLTGPAEPYREQDYAGYELVLNGDTSQTLHVLRSYDDAGASMFEVAGDWTALLAGNTLTPAIRLDEATVCQNCPWYENDLLLLDAQNPWFVSNPSIAPLYDGGVLSGETFEVFIDAQDHVRIAEVAVTFNGTTVSQTTRTATTVSVMAPTVASDQTYSLDVVLRDDAGNQATYQQDVLVKASVVPAYGETLLTDGGFEAGSLQGWVVLEGTVELKNADPAPAEGNQYLEVTDEPHGEIDLYRDVFVTPYAAAIDQSLQAFHLSYWVVGRNSSNLIDFEVLFLDAQNQVLGTQILPDYTFDLTWGYETLVLQPPAGTRKLRLQISGGNFGSSSARFLLDGLSLEALPALADGPNLAVVSVTAPTTAQAGAQFPIEVEIANLGTQSLSAATLNLFNDTSSASWSQATPSLNVGETALLTFTFNESNPALGLHQLRAQVSGVTGDVAAADDTFAFEITFEAGEAEFYQQLLVNPGGEEAVPGDAWSAVSGNWTNQVWGGSARTGSGYLRNEDANGGTLQQDTNVAAFVTTIDQGTQSFLLQGWLSSNHPDNRQDLGLVFLDESLNVLATDTTALNQSISNGVYNFVSLRATAPVGTRVVRSQLSTQSTYSSANFYFDDLKLQALDPASATLPQPSAFWALDNSDLNAGTYLPIAGSSTLQQGSGVPTNDGFAGEGLELNEAFSEVAHSSDTALAAHYSFSLWINADDFSDTNASLVTKAGGFKLGQADSLGKLFLEATDQVGTTYRAQMGSRLLPNRWYQVVGVYDVDSLSLYVDGIPLVSVAVNDTPANVTSALHLGSASGSSAAFHGTMDEFGFWQSALTPAEVMELYEAGPTGDHRLLFDTTAPLISAPNVSPLYNGAMGSGETITVAFELDERNPDTVTVTLADETVSASGAGLVELTLQAPTVASDTAYDLVIHATDANGLTDQWSQSYTVIAPDTTAPLVTIVSPADGAALVPGSAVDVELQVVDDRAVAQIDATFDGDLQSLTYQTAEYADQQTVIFTWSVPQSAPPEGLLLNVSALDPTGLTGTATATYTLGSAGLPKPEAYFTFDNADMVDGTPLDVAGLRKPHVVDSNGSNHVGIIDQAIRFYSNNVLTTDGDAALDMAQSVTLAGWVKVDYAYNQAGIAIYGNNALTNYGLVTLSGNKLAFVSGAEQLETDAFSLGTWFHLAATFNHGDAKLFVDGALVNEATWASSTLGNTGTSWLQFGTNQTNNTSFRGYLDEFGIWSEALVAVQINDLYTSGTQAQRDDWQGPEAPTNLTVDQVTADGFRINWTASADTAGDLMGYELQVGSDPVVALDANATSYTVSGLSASQTYPVRLQAVDFTLNKGAAATVIGYTESAVVSSLSPRSYWTLDDVHKVAYHAGDVFGNNNSNYTTVNADQVQVKGDAVRFSSSGNRVEIPEFRELWHEQAWSFAFWFNPDSLFTGPLLNYGTSSQSRFLVELNQSPQRQIVLTSGSGQTLAVSGPLARDGHPLTSFAHDAWHHMVITFNSGQIRVYLNGEAISAADWSGASMPASDDAFLVLGNKTNTNSNFRGHMDEVLFWHRALPHFEAVKAASTTLDLVPPAQASDLQVVAGANALTVSWTLSSEDASEVDHYQISLDGSVVASVPAGQNSTQLTGLIPFTAYDVSLTAVDAAGNARRPTTMRASTQPNSMASFPQPLSYWTMNSSDMQSNVPVDVMGTHPPNYGSLYANQNGVLDKGIRFSSSSHFMDVPAYDTLLAGDVFTVATWISPTTFLNRAILSFGDDTNSAFELKTVDEDGHRVWWQLGNADPISHGSAMAGNNRQLYELSINEWQHVVLVSDGNTARMYLNAEKIAEFTISAGQRPALTDPWLTLGRNPRNNMTPSVYMDETGVWGQALSEAAIRLLYASAKSGQTLDLRPPEDGSDLVVTPAADQLALSWTASADTQGDLAGYEVFLDGVSVTTLAPGTTAHTITGLTAATFYEVVVRAFDQLDRTSHGLYRRVATLPADVTTLPKPVIYFSYDADAMDIYDPNNLAGAAPVSFSNLYGNQTSPLDKAVRYSSSSHKTTVLLEDGLASGNFTLATWARISTFSNRHVLALGNATDERFALQSTNSPGGDALELVLDNGNESHIVGYEDYANGYQLSELNTSDWVHVLLSYDGSLLKFYLNGELWHEINWVDGLASLPSDAWLSLGYRPAAPGNPAGYVDETLLWDVALSESQVDSIFSLGQVGQPLDEQPIDFRMPADISNLTATATVDSLTLQWLASPDEGSDLNGYNVYVNDVFDQALASGTTTVTLTGLTENTAYDVRITALDVQQNESVGVTLPAATAASAGLPAAYAYWTMDDRTYYELNDQMSNVTSTYLNGSAHSSGQVGDALRLGSSYRAEFDNIALDPTAGFSLSTWVYLTSDNPGGILALGNDTTETFGLVLDDTNGNQFRFTTNGTVAEEAVGSVVKSDPDGNVYQQVEASRWYHIGMVYDGTQASLYVDGHLSETATWSAQAMPLPDPAKLVLGQHHPGSDTYVNGYLDETAIWTSALSESNLRNAYLKGLNGEHMVASGTPLSKRRLQPDRLHHMQAVDGVITIEDQQMVLEDVVTPYTLVFMRSQVHIQGNLSAAGVFFLDQSEVFVAGEAVASMRTGHLEIGDSARLVLGRGIGSGGHFILEADSLVLDGTVTTTDDTQNASLVLTVDEIFGAGQVDLQASGQAQMALLAPNARQFAGHLWCADLWIVENGGEFVYHLSEYAGEGSLPAESISNGMEVFERHIKNQPLWQRIQARSSKHTVCYLVSEAEWRMKMPSARR